ncbi:MAG: hypothetical protein CMD31_00150 [Flavobacteriales bacterium]|nr:hypothetical protein [Flavobacteriales bacterium]
MKNIFWIIWKWLKARFHTPIDETISFMQDGTRAERRKYKRLFKHRYLGSGNPYTPVPSIH